MIRLTIPALALLAAACGPVEPMPGPIRGKCDASAGQRFVGQQWRAGIGERARRVTQSKTVRVIRPGMAVTMDYREDRVNVSLNPRGRIESVRCG